MNEAVERALRALAEARIGTQAEPSSGQPPAQVLREGFHGKARGRPEASQLPELPDGILLTRYPLEALSRAALDSLPAAGKLSAQERCIILEALEALVRNWLQNVFQPERAWAAACPKGHYVTDGIFARCLLGWTCPECKQVYAPGECQLRLEGK